MSDKLPTIPNATPDMTLKERQSFAARATLVEATMGCLDRFGYSDTSINRIQEAANVSRGALTHHFPTKEDLIVATLDRLLITTLRPSLPSKRADSDKGLVGDLHYIARGLSRSREGRALVEILVAMRTDKNLRDRVSPRLQEWDQMIGEAITGYYEAVSGNEEDLVLIWTIMRSFLRGLILQEPFSPDERKIETMITRMGEIFNPLLRPRSKLEHLETYQRDKNAKSL
jgi:AcrR family transcriptional regulator